MAKHTQNKFRKFSMTVNSGQKDGDQKTTINDLERQLQMPLMNGFVDLNYAHHVNEDERLMINSFKDSPFAKAFSPVISTMKVFGLFYDRSTSPGLSSGCPSLEMVYCWLITILAWLNVFFLLVSMRKVG